jgi:hypothetical protein
VTLNGERSSAEVVTNSLRESRLTGIMMAIPAVLICALFSLAIWRGFDVGIALVIAFVGLALAAWRPFEVGTLLWLAGPLFGASFLLPLLNADQLMSLLGTVILCAAAWRDRTPLRVTSITVLSFAMTLSVGVTALANGGIGAVGVVRFGSTAIASLILMSSTAKHSAFLTRALVVVSSLSALIVIAQRFTRWPTPTADIVSSGFRYGGLIGHPNFAAYSLACAALAIFVMAKKRNDYLPLFVLIPAMILTGSMTAMIMFVLALIGYAGLRRPKSLIWLGLAGASLLPLAYVLMSRLQFAWSSGGIEGANSSGWRLIQWQRSWALGVSSRGLGIGWGRAAELLPQNLGVHSLYMEVAVELGYLGIACLSIGIVALIIGSRKSAVQFVTCFFALGGSIMDPVLLYPAVMAMIVVAWAADESANRSGALDNSAVAQVPAAQRKHVLVRTDGARSSRGLFERLSAQSSKGVRTLE